MHMDESRFPDVFEQLKGILQPFQDDLLLKKDTDREYALDTPYSEKWKRELMFGAVQIQKRYVSFHLFPVYMFPDLLDGLSDGSRKRMQGKSCFNFTRVDPELYGELKELTARGFERLKSEGVI